MFEIIISILTISFLIILHELGHYLTAKKFGVKVEEFGLGLPPRLYGKKIGETIWSLNWIPIGGFVRMQEGVVDPIDQEQKEGERVYKNRSFNAKPVWQRMLIVVAGCLFFWLIAILIFVSIFIVGTSVAIDDYEIEPNAIVQITKVVEGSPAELARIKIGDIIQKIRIDNNEYNEIKVNKKSDVINFIQENPGQNVAIYIKRNNELLTKNIILDNNERSETPKIGVALIRIVPDKNFPISEAIPKSIERTYRFTILIGQGLFGAIGNLITGREVEDVAGPVGIVRMMGQRLGLGITYFLFFVAIIAINLAIINLLPIPGLDGGKIIFLIYEGIRKKPFPQKIESYATGFFLILLLSLMLIVTIGEIRTIF